jgi:hypothetical protein
VAACRSARARSPFRPGGAALAVLLLLCGAATCGPAHSVDRAELATEDAGGAGGTGGLLRPDATGGRGGSGGLDGPGDSGGSGGQDASSDLDPGPDSADPPDAGMDGPDPFDASPPDTAPEDAALPADAPPDSLPLELPLVSVSHAPGVASTNLTVEGSLDWRHWGYRSSAAANRKLNGPGIIGMQVIGTGVVGRYIDRPVLFSWVDGSPSASASNTPDGIVVGDRVGHGFQIEVTGSPTAPRRIKMHVGVWGARARLTASLSDRAGALYTDDTLVASEPGADRIYTVDFQPEVPAQKLVLRWTVDAINRMYGNVTLQAVSAAE